jgi:hypothetical protein
VTQGASNAAWTFVGRLDIVEAASFTAPINQTRVSRDQRPSVLPMTGMQDFLGKRLVQAPVKQLVRRRLGKNAACGSVRRRSARLKGAVPGSGGLHVMEEPHLQPFATM